MTITPTAPTPAAVPPGAAGAGTTPEPAPGDFLALVQKALSAAVGDATATAPGDAAAATAPGVAGAAEGGGTEPGDTAPASDPALAAAAAGLTALVAPVAPVNAAIPQAPGAATGPVAVVAGPTAIASSPTDAPGGSRAVAASGPATGTDRHIPSDASADPVAGTAGVPDAPVAPAAAGHGNHASADPGTGGQGASPNPAAIVAPTLGSPSAPAAAPAPAPVAAGPVPTATATPQVGGQVFPEVTSLASRGNGTHRITLTLKPEALGEVRVVMTVRDGAVHVRLAAGHEAQQALLAGSPELGRLLEHAGATESRIVVRDLLGTTTPTSGTSTDTGPDLGQGQGLGAGSNRPQDQHAGTRAERHATDGTHDTTTTGATPPRPVQPVTHTRSSGVDVTM